MYKIFVNAFIILSAILFFGSQVKAENWLQTNNILGNMIYVDTDSIQQKDNRIFYYAKYYEDKINNDSKVVIMSEGNHPFVIAVLYPKKNKKFLLNIL